MQSWRSCILAVVVRMKGVLGWTGAAAVGDVRWKGDLQGRLQLDTFSCCSGSFISPSALQAWVALGFKQQG